MYFASDPPSDAGGTIVEPSPRIRSPQNRSLPMRKQRWSSVWPGVASAVSPATSSPSAGRAGSTPSSSTPPMWSRWEWVTSTVPMPPRSSAAARTASMWPASSGPGSITITGSRPTR